MPIVINMLLSLISFTALSSIKGLSNRINVIRLIKYYAWFVILLTAIDTLLRYKYPIYNLAYLVEGSDKWFYQYKHSYILGDSNVVAILIISCLFLQATILSFYKERILNVQSYILLFILALTISRSAYIATIIGMLVLFCQVDKRVKYLLIIVCGASLIPISTYVFDFLVNDRSGVTKLNEWFSVLNFFEDSSAFDIIFGVGFGYGNEVSGRYIHSLFAKLIIEGGLLMTLFFLLGVIFLIVKKTNVAFYLIPLLISSLSLSFYIFSPFQAVSIALILVTSRENSDGKI